MSHKLASDDPVSARAVRWMVHLSSGEASADDYDAFTRWRSEDPRHEAAALQLEQSLGRFNQLPVNLRTRANRILQPMPRRHLLRSALGFGLVAAGGGFVLHRYQPVSQLLADASTGTGERRKWELPDGSSLLLNARSAVDLIFTRSHRQIHLRTGELIVDVVNDMNRPFEVTTSEGTVRALGTRFLVRQDEGSSFVSVLESSVNIKTRQDIESRLDMGTSARFGEFGIQQDSLTPDNASAWQDGFIELHDRPLADLISALRAYRPGVLCISPEAAKLRVTGSFSLDNSNRTLNALAKTLPLKITYRTDYWVSIDLQPA